MDYGSENRATRTSGTFSPVEVLMTHRILWFACTGSWLSVAGQTQAWLDYYLRCVPAISLISPGGDSYNGSREACEVNCCRLRSDRCVHLPILRMSYSLLLHLDHGVIVDRSGVG